MFNQFGMGQGMPFGYPAPAGSAWGQNQLQLQRTEIIRVNGENGARTYQMAPNSSALLLDESAPLVWLVQTDGAGYKTATSYTISPPKATPAPDYGALEDRVKRLEEMLNGWKSDTGAAGTVTGGE